MLSAFSMNFAVFAEEMDPDAGGEPPAVPVDTSLLEKAIGDAADAKSGVRPSIDGSDVKESDLWAPQSAFSSLNASINEAKNALANPELTQPDSDAQAAVLAAAIDTFKSVLKYGTKTEGPPAEPELVDAVYMKSGDISSDGKQHFVGEDFEAKYKNVSISEKGKTVQLNGYYTTNMSDGAMYGTEDSSSPLGPVALSWASSDIAIATVSPNGLVTPIADGEVEITITVSEDIKYSGSAPTKSVTLKVSGQTGEYVKSVTIIGEDGESLSSKDDASTVIDGKNKFLQFYAKVVWHDPSTGADRTEDTRTDTVSSTIKWTVGGSNVCGTVNEDTGRFKSAEYSGNCFVQCAVTGGVDGKTVKDVALVQVDTGEYAYNPADSLTLRVVYQEFPDTLVQEHRYALPELASRLGIHTDNYTILGGSKYGTIRASGYLFKDVVALEGVNIDDVYQYRFTTADGYDNPITSQLLYGSGARYYFPNWDIGGSRAGAKVVPPILATESNMIWGQSELGADAALDSATRFRLVFGPLWGGESNSSFQIYYINTVTIVLKGAPPADNGKGADKGSGSDGGNNDGSKTPVGTAETQDAGGSGGNGNGGNGKGGPGGSGGGSGSSGEGSGASGEGAAEQGGSGSAGTGQDGQADTAAAKAEPKGSQPKAAGGDGWKIYEMLSNSKSSVAPINTELPYLSAAVPIACGSVAAGGLSFFIGFRRRLILGSPI
jgi:hypothetical protein